MRCFDSPSHCYPSLHPAFHPSNQYLTQIKRDCKRYGASECPSHKNCHREESQEPVHGNIRAPCFKTEAAGRRSRRKPAVQEKRVSELSTQVDKRVRQQVEAQRWGRGPQRAANRSSPTRPGDRPFSIHKATGDVNAFYFYF